MADSPDTFVLMLRLGVSLGLVLALVGAVTWVLRRRGLLRAGVGARVDRLEVIDRKSLGKRSSVVVARIGDVSMLLGVTDQQVSVLARLDGAEEVAEEPAACSVQPERVAALVAADLTADAAELDRAPVAAATPMDMGSRRTGTRADAQRVPATQTRMSFVDALRELTVRSS